MAGISYTIDFTEFNKKLSAIIKNVPPDDVSVGMREALQELKLDADNVPPRTPHLEGHLRASGKVQKIKITTKEISGELTYDAPYAKRWHEVEPGTIKWSEPDVGPKYIESKVVKFMKKYLEIIAAVIKKRAK